mmetsp:Transcript_84267/g.219298  ORF Transcript_84267/g.219298 Transcript_84267/m.219298 type:complete len:378 (+) Transcript_84267:60-1193(+)
MVLVSMLCTIREQLLLLLNILRNLIRILTDPKMGARISLKSFGIDFVGMLLQEGLTNPGTTCEQVAEECLGKGNFGVLRGKVAIITGASGGLGLEHARVLLKYGCHVVFAVRSTEKAEVLLHGLRAREELSGPATILRVDLDDLSTIQPFVQEFLALGLPLNYLVNNAGVMTPTEFRGSKQGYETQFATNHLAHFLLTELLMPKLRETKKLEGDAADVRVITLSSVGSTLCRNFDMDRFLPPAREMYNGTAEYGMSKALNLFHSRELQRRCAEDGILCCAVHPGVIKTGLTREANMDSTMLYEFFIFKLMHKDVPQGAATQMYCTLSAQVPAEIASGTCFWYNSGPQQAVGVAAPGVRDDLCSKLWEISEALVEPYR